MVERTKVHLVQTNGLAHRRLDVERLHVLPVLLEQRHEEVDACEESGQHSPMRKSRTRTQHDIGQDLVIGHLDVADGDTKAENLLELELDRRADLGDLVGKVLSVGDGRGELASCGESQYPSDWTRMSKAYP